jgi:hypothetical protein
LFKIEKENWMMPTPFVLNDAVVIRQKIKASPVVVPVVEKWIPNQVQKIQKNDN